MANAILAIPEEHLPEVVDVIRAGLFELRGKISEDVKKQLLRWCFEGQAALLEEPWRPQPGENVRLAQMPYSSEDFTVGNIYVIDHLDHGPLIKDDKGVLRTVSRAKLEPVDKWGVAHRGAGTAKPGEPWCLSTFNPVPLGTPVVLESDGVPIAISGDSACGGTVIGHTIDASRLNTETGLYECSVQPVD